MAAGALKIILMMVLSFPTFDNGFDNGFYLSLRLQ